ncbi:leucine-rich repeat-containing protein 63-like [Symsagittifera roscoffensis]|uniref:leucine-rich repeat-containing protein 63-like n=1 Tax=Symsagittifera roscoffensis TaxID=84072 RepID=UPI00307C4A09
MHPLLWRNLTKGNNVQSLKDLCCAVITRSKIDIHAGSKKLPSNILNVLKPEGVCDCCGSGMFGEGLKVVRPARKIFGVTNVPFLFVSCSPYCLTEFNNNSKNTAKHIYKEE